MNRSLDGKKKNKISVSSIDMIYDAIKDRNTDVKIKKEGDTIEIESGPKMLKISKDGGVKGSMPLHSFETLKAEEVMVKDDEIEIYFDRGNYVFKI